MTMKFITNLLKAHDLHRRNQERPKVFSDLPEWCKKQGVVIDFEKFFKWADYEEGKDFLMDLIAWYKNDEYAALSCKFLAEVYPVLISKMGGDFSTRTHYIYNSMVIRYFDGKMYDSYARKRLDLEALKLTNPWVWRHQFEALDDLLEKPRKSWLSRKA